MLAGVFTVPVKSDGGLLCPIPPDLAPVIKRELRCGDMEEEELLQVVEEDPSEEVVVEAPKDDMDKWEDELPLRQDGEKVEVRNYTMVEILDSRKGSSIVNALNRMAARLGYLGFGIRRLHSD